MDGEQFTFNLAQIQNPRSSSLDVHQLSCRGVASKSGFGLTAPDCASRADADSSAAIHNIRLPHQLRLLIHTSDDLLCHPPLCLSLLNLFSYIVYIISFDLSKFQRRFLCFLTC